MAAAKDQKKNQKDQKKTKEGPRNVQDLLKEISAKRMELLGGKLKDVRTVSKLRDELARVKTAERMKELEHI